MKSMCPAWRCAALYLMLAAGFFTSPITANAQPVAQPLGAGESLLIDGRLDEPAWARTPEYERFIQFLPIDGQPPPPGYRTTVKVLVADDALIIGIHAFDPDPAQIRGPLVRRDKVFRDQDFVAVVLDGAGTRRSAQFARVNAAGVLADGVYLYDGDVEDFAPDFDVEAAAARLPDGYSVELRLPLLTLRYPFDGGRPWRFMVARNIPREQTTLLLTAPLTRDSPAFIAELEPLLGLEGAIAQARDRPLLTVRPELTWRRVKQSANGDSVRSDGSLSIGTDIKWRPRADWVIDATINPDFSQVELDTPQLAGNTRFALSVLEKRPFFLESTDLLDLPLPGFYSRAITDPRLGLRATWRAPDRDASALAMVDDGGGLLLRPGAFGTTVLAQDARADVALLRTRWHLQDATLGALLSLRDAEDGRRNHVVGADVFARSGDADEWRLRAMACDTDERAAGGAHDAGYHALISWHHLSTDWRVKADLTRISPRFRNDNGFVEQAGVDHAEVEIARRLGELDLGALQANEFEFFLWSEHTSTLADTSPVAGPAVAADQMIERRWHPGIWWAGARASEGWARLELDSERAQAGGRLHPTPALAASYSLNPTSWFPRLNVELEWGKRLDVDADRVGTGGSLLIEARFRGALGHIGFESDHRFEQSIIQGAQGRRALTETGWQWIGVMHLTTQDSMRFVWQGQNFERAADGVIWPQPVFDRQRTTSWVVQHRVGIRTSLSAGWTRAVGQPGATRDVELFAKAAIAF